MPTPESMMAELDRQFREADADALIGMLAVLAVNKMEMDEQLRRRLIRTTTLKLMQRVLDPGFMEEGT